LLWSFAFLVAQSSLWGRAAQGQERQHRVLVYPDSSHIAAVGPLGDALQKKLADRSPRDVQLFNEFLELC
jgi:hypothetical protein